MMKKLYKFSAFAALLLSTALTSCTNEVDDIFDSSAAQRADEAKKTYKEILLDKGGKWQMEYFTTEDEHGYVYLFTFKNDGTVTISGDNEYISKLTNVDATNSTFGSESSLWTILSDNGPVLSFNSYNKYFHLFSDPEDIPGTERDEQGYGHSGDYEFDLMKYSGDTLYLEGKKNGAEIIMTRIDSEIDDEKYLNEVVAMADSFFNAKIPTVYVNLPGGYRHVVLDGATQLPKFYPETGDYITEYVGRNAIITHDGFTLGKPLTLRDSIDGNDYTIQHFIRQADGSLLCTDDNRITITADALNKVATDATLLWRFEGTKGSGELGNLFTQISTGLKAYNGASIVNFYYGTGTVNSTKVNSSFVIRVRRKSGGYTNLTYTYTTQLVGGNEFKFVLGTMDSYMQAYVNNTPALKAFFDKLASTTFKCSSSSLLAPTTMVLSDSADASSSLVVSL